MGVNYGKSIVNEVNDIDDILTHATHECTSFPLEDSCFCKIFFGKFVANRNNMFPFDEDISFIRLLSCGIQNIRINDGDLGFRSRLFAAKAIGQ